MGEEVARLLGSTGIESGPRVMYLVWFCVATCACSRYTCTYIICTYIIWLGFGVKRYSI